MFAVGSFHFRIVVQLFEYFIQSIIPFSLSLNPCCRIAMEETTHLSGENKKYDESKNKSSAPSSAQPIEFPQYESLTENSESFETETKSLEVSSNGSGEELGGKMCELGDRNDVENHLHEVKSSNSEAFLHSAINEILAGGDAADVVEKVISRRGLRKYIGEGDPWTNIQNTTRNVLEGKDVATLKDTDLENFQHLLQFTTVDLIDELREVRPSLTVTQAMWLLLMYDFNVSVAYAIEQDRRSDLLQEEESANNSANLQLEMKCNPPNFQNGSCSSPDSSDGINLEVKGDSDSLSLNSKESASPREGSAQAKLQPSVFEKKSGPSSAQQNPKGTTTPGGKGNLKIEKPENIGAGVLPYYAGIPYDRSLGKYVPQDKADEQILSLVPRLQELQQQLKHWKEVGAKRVMEVARKLKQDEQEINILKKEIKEATEYTEERKNLEIAQMDNILADVRSKIERTRSAARSLELQNSALKEDLDAAKLQSTKLMTSHEKELERENIALAKAESCKTQKCLLEDELEKEKQKSASLQQEVDKEKALHDEIEAEVEKQMAEKEKLLAQAEAIRKEGEQLQKRGEIEEEKIREKLAKNQQNYDEEIAKLERELAELKSTAWIVGFSKMNKKAKGKTAAGRECVMCLEDEISVVFLPCGHQIVCANCNEVLEKLGVEDCPSCRTPIQERIRAIFA